MADIVWPLESWAQPVKFWCGIRSNVIVRTSTLNGEVTTSQIPGSRWIFRLEFSDNGEIQGIQPKLEALIASTEGQVHRIVMPHLWRKRPRGTLSGTPTAGGAPRGARSMVINGQSGQTLLPGDMLGVTTGSGYQLIMVTSALGTGTIAINFVAPLRAVVEAGSPVVWNAPTARLIMMNPETMVGHSPQGHPGVSLDLMETFV